MHCYCRLVEIAKLCVHNAACAQCNHYICKVHIVHPESFRSNAQNANAFACRNRPHVERNDEFACVYLRLRACVRLHSFASTVRDQPRSRMCVRMRVRR